MRAWLVFILWWGLWTNVLAAGSLDSLDSQLTKLKQDYAEKESTLTQAQRDLSLVQHRVRDATADLQTAQTQLVEEEKAFKSLQDYTLHKKMAIDAKAEAEYKAAVNKKELAADNLQRRQRAESEAIAYVQKLQADVQGLSSAVNRVGNDLAVARFEVIREKFEKETEVIFELRFSCGEEVTTKQCREMGRNAADEKAQKLGAVSLLKSVTEADLARLQVTENKVKEELIALVMRRKQLEPEESVKNGEYYGKWSMWVKGQVPESLRPQAGAVLVGGKFSPVMPVSTGQKTIKNSIDYVITCAGEKLQFVKITPEPSLIEISLTAEKAGNISRQAQQMTNSSIDPYVFRAVSDAEGKYLPVVINVKPFWIQTSPVSQHLYSKVMGKGYLINRVSYNDATKFAETLPAHCEGLNSQFSLPTEEQFVYLSRRIYKDNNTLKKCNDLSKVKTPEGIEKLLGHQWQLTKSSCISWSNDDSNPSGQCTGNGNSYVKKGGTTHSKDTSECIPEYRAESTPDVREPDTTLRLIWIEP